MYLFSKEKWKREKRFENNSHCKLLMFYSSVSISEMPKTKPAKNRYICYRIRLIYIALGLSFSYNFPFDFGFLQSEQTFQQCFLSVSVFILLKIHAHASSENAFSIQTFLSWKISINKCVLRIQKDCRMNGAFDKLSS